MAYRDDSEPLKERYESLAKTLEQIRNESRALSSQEAELAKELEAIRARLYPEQSDRRQLPLANVRIASPCQASWADMVGDDRTRFCSECRKHVHDLTKMSTAEVESFLHARSDGTCVRLYQRTDGRVITDDCPVGVRRRRARALVATMFGAGACALLSLTAIARVMTSEISPIDMRQPTPPIYLPTPVTPPVAEPRPETRPETRMGFVWVEGPEGTRVFEGEQFLGTAPLMFPMTEGTHVLRAVEAKTGKQVFTVQHVPERGVITYRAEFGAKARKDDPDVHRGRTMGKMVIDRNDPTNSL
jgi:hypothetical protein